MKNIELIYYMVVEFFKENGMAIGLFFIGAIGNWYKNRKQNLTKFELAVSFFIGGIMSWVCSPFLVHFIRNYVYTKSDLDSESLASLYGTVGFFVGMHGLVLFELLISFLKNKYIKND